MNYFPCLWVGGIRYPHHAVAYDRNITYTYNPSASRIPYVTLVGCAHQQPPYGHHPPYSLTFGLLQHLHGPAFCYFTWLALVGRPRCYRTLLHRFFVRMPLNLVLRLCSGDRGHWSGISQSNFCTTANTALKRFKLERRMGFEPMIPTLGRSYSANWTTFAPWVRRYHICLTPISLSAFDPRLYSSEGQTAYYFRLFRLNKNQLNISQYVKEPFVYVGWNFLSFLSTSIYNQPRTELNTPPKLFWNFFAFYSFSIIYTVHQKRSSVCANDLLVSGLYF